MKNTVFAVQIVVAVTLILAILVQSKGTGLGRVWGGSPSSFTRRGLEKIIFKATFILSAVFIIVSILQMTV